jgi:hypothetical protein
MRKLDDVTNKVLESRRIVNKDATTVWQSQIGYEAGGAQYSCNMCGNRVSRQTTMTILNLVILFINTYVHTPYHIVIRMMSIS